MAERDAGRRDAGRRGRTEGEEEVGGNSRRRAASFSSGECRNSHNATGRGAQQQVDMISGKLLPTWQREGAGGAHYITISVFVIDTKVHPALNTSTVGIGYYDYLGTQQKNSH